MGGTHNNSVGAWKLLGRMIGWAYNGDVSAPTVLSLPNPSASRVPIVATHTTDGGAYPGLLPALGRAISYSGHRPLAIRLQEILQGRLTAANFKVVTFPGGYAYGYKTGLSGAEQNIRDFLSNGGSYFGICAGSFYAASTVVWQGQSYSYPLGIFQSQVVGEISDIVAWPGYALTPTSVNDAVLGQLGSVQQMYYGGGYHALPSNQTVFTAGTFTYNGSASNKAEAVRFSYGQGRVFLITTHPEARAGSVDDWVYWDGFQNESSVPIVNPDNPWRVVSAVFNQWLAPQGSSSFQIQACERLTGGGLRLHCSGPAGLLPTVLVSSNLANWASFGTAAEESPGHYVLADTNSPFPRQRFYRVRSP
jgi:hypothetical protein